MKTPLDYTVGQQVKAILSGLVAALALLAGAADDGLSTAEILSALGTALGTYIAVFYAPNTDPEGEDDDTASTRAGDGGHGAPDTIWLVLGVLGIVLLVLFLVGRL